MTRFSQTLGVSILLFAGASCESSNATDPAPSDPAAEQSYPADELEFLQESVVEVKKTQDAGAWLLLGPHSRKFRIHPPESPDPAGMITMAREARANGLPLYATVWNPDPLPKSAENLQKGNWWYVVRLAKTPDPRSE